MTQKETTATNCQTTNPAALGLTDAQNEIYNIIVRRQGNSLTTTAGDIREEYRDRDRSWIYRILQALIKKKLVETYSRNFYRLTEPKLRK